jgi:hypothetical protein
MSSDYLKSKKNSSSTFPSEAIDAASFSRLQPLITPEQLKSRYLRGLTLISPITRTAPTSEELKDDIIRAASLVEMDLKITIFPVKHRKRLPFQREDYDSYIYTLLPDKPILSIDKMSITSSNDTDIYVLPKEWIDPANFNYGLVNVIPLSPAAAGSGSSLIMSTGSGVGNFLLFLGTQQYMPAYWQVEYTTGFNMEQGIPAPINELIGMRAAMMTLQNLIPQVQFSSHSLGLDGLSQGQSNQAAQLYEKVYGMLQAQYDKISKDVASQYYSSIIMNSLG